MCCKLEVGPVGAWAGAMNITIPSRSTSHRVPICVLCPLCKISLLTRASMASACLVFYMFTVETLCAKFSGDSKSHSSRQNKSDNLVTAESADCPDLRDIHCLLSAMKVGTEPWAGLHTESSESNHLGNSCLMHTAGCINNNGHEICGPHFGIASFPVATHQSFPFCSS